MACGVGAGADTRSAKGDSHVARATTSAGPQHLEHLPTVPHFALVLPVLLQVLLKVNRLKPWEYYEDSHSPSSNTSTTEESLPWLSDPESNNKQKLDMVMHI